MVSKRHLHSPHQSLIHNNNKPDHVCLRHWAVLHKVGSWEKKLDIFIFTRLYEEPSESFGRRKCYVGRESVGMPDIVFCEGSAFVTHMRNYAYG